MKVIKPSAITEAMLISSSIVETAPAAYAGGTTYALDATASVAGAAGLLTVYKSLQGSNTGHTPSSSPTWWVNIGETYQLYSSFITYALGERVLDVATHIIYESVVAGNVGNALSDLLKWLPYSPSNKWAMFDGQVSNIAIAPSSITMTLATGVIDAVALIDTYADIAYLTVRDGLGGTIVHEDSRGLVGDIVTDWYGYFFGDPFNRVAQAVFQNIPPFPSSHITITLIANGQNVSLGELVFGRANIIGTTQYSPSVGIIDYSRKDTDAFGKTTFVKRAFKKRLSARVVVDNLQLNRVQRLLYDLRATPCVWIGTDAPGYDEALLLYAFYKDFSMEIAYPTTSLCSLELEGLI